MPAVHVLPQMRLGAAAPAATPAADPLAWRSLPWAAQSYVALVTGVGVVMLGAAFPLEFPNPVLFATLLVASCLTSAWKVNLPLAQTSGATLSMSYAANLAALLLLGAPYATIVAAAGVWTQCAVNVKVPYPVYRTAFSMAAEVVTMQATAAVYGWLGGGTAPLTLVDLPKPLVGAIVAYFCVNTGLVTGAIGLSTGQSPWKVWCEDFLWSAPSFMVAGAAGAVAAVVLQRGQWGHAILMAAPVYLTYRTYRIFVGRLDDQRRHAAEARRLHDETLEALLQARRAEQAVVQEKERLAVTLRSVGDGVITTDLTGRVLLLNEVAERLTGWRQDEAIGQPLSAVFRTFDPETRAPRDLSGIDSLAGADAPRESRCTVLVARDLTEQRIEEIAAPLCDSSGGQIGMVLAFRDISDALKVQAEHAKASKLESLGLLAGGIAHDFNNLLMTIIGNVAMARVSDSQRGPATRALAEAEQACMRARQLTWHLLSFATGGVPVKETIGVAAPLNEAIRLALRGLNTSCRVQIPDDLRAIQADERQLIQAFANVLENAHEAMPQNGSIEIEGANTFEPLDRWENALRVPAGHYVTISIADSGTGIPRDQLCRVFDPYFSTKPGRTGLGLATAHSILKNHGGFVSIESASGRGTRVKLSFPALPIRSRADFTSIRAGRGRRRVLVMDDDASNRILSVNMLEFLGYATTAVDDGTRAVEHFMRARDAGAPFDAVMLDLMVPGGMGGKEAIVQLAEADPAVKAILVSGYSSDPAMTEFGRYGFAAVLAKPFSVHELSMTIDFVLGAPACRIH
jgi:PAS domain S-box-containing protein